MTHIIPIPASRVGDLFVRQRLIGQVQADQLGLFKLQNQISTGQRLQLPSDDAPAALRAINLQRLLDRKGQIQTNLQSSGFYLAAAESTLGIATQELAELRGDVLAVNSTLATDAQRQAVIQKLDGTLKSLVDTANSTAQGRFLFGGSRTGSLPFDYNGSFVEYLGNERTLRNYVDLERLFDTNLPGTEVFGGVSSAVQGSVDLNPQTTELTRLSTLNGGAGITKDAAISLTTTVGFTPTTTVVDLSKAVTLGDVARLIESAAPASADLTVDVTGTGLVLRSASGTITVNEVAQGKAARELGIFTGQVAGGGTITGADLNPAVIKTTALADLLGAQARGRLVSADPNNDLVISATQNGAGFNNLTVQFVPGATAGSEVAAYDSGTNTLTVQIQSGISTAAQVAAAINAEGTFKASPDYRDATNPTQAGSTAVATSTFTGVTSGGSGQPLDTASGLVLTNGNRSVTLDISAAKTVEDLLNLMNGAQLGIVAEINDNANGINVRSRLSGADLTIGENGGTTATQLGIRTFTGTTLLSDLNRGLGVPSTSALEQFDASNMDELRIVARNGVELAVNLTTATSLADVAALINAHPLNSGDTRVTAGLSSSGNGIELVDASDDGAGNIAGPLQVRVVGGTQAAEYLGLVPPGSSLQTSQTTDTSGNYVLSGRNVLGHDFLIEARSGVKIWIDLGGAKSVQDVIDRINTDSDNVPQVITARLARVGNGIELVDTSVGAGTLTVRTVDGSQAAEFLGFVPTGANASSASDVTTEGTNQVLNSGDRHTVEAEGVFNTLLRLRAALVANNTEEISKSLDRLDNDISRISFARAEIGIRLQNLDVVSLRLEDENVQLRSALSLDLDVDIIEAVSNLTARQYAFEASLRTAATLLQTTLLNYL